MFVRKLKLDIANKHKLLEFEKYFAFLSLLLVLFFLNLKKTDKVTEKIIDTIIK